MSTNNKKFIGRIKFNKNLILIVVSFVFAALAVYLAKEFIEDKISFYENQLNTTEKLVSVIVPKRNMQNGEIVSSNDFAVREIPESYAHANGVDSTTFNIAVGQRLSFDVAKGRALLWAHLEGGIMPTFSGKIPEGLRAMTITVDKISSISGFLQPTDNIDLLLEYKDSVFPVLQNIRVLATGTRTRIDKTGRESSGTFNSITIEVTPEIARKVTLARSLGNMTAVLRSPKDSDLEGINKTTVAHLLNQPKKVYKKRAVKKGVEFIIGGR